MHWQTLTPAHNSTCTSQVSLVSSPHLGHLSNICSRCTLLGGLVWHAPGCPAPCQHGRPPLPGFPRRAPPRTACMLRALGLSGPANPGKDWMGPMPGHCQVRAAWATLVAGPCAGYHGLAHARVPQKTSCLVNPQGPEFRDACICMSTTIHE